jgi:hypothetical protein
VKQVHEQRTASAIVSTERRVLGEPLAVCLDELVGAISAVHGVNVRDKESPVRCPATRIYMDITRYVDGQVKVARHVVAQPAREERGTLTVMGAFEGQRTAQGLVQDR